MGIPSDKWKRVRLAIALTAIVLAVVGGWLLRRWAEHHAANELMGDLIRIGDIEGVRWALGTGIDVNSRAHGYNGYSLLDTAASEGQAGVVDLLISAGAQIQAPAAGELSPLHLANNAATARLLVEAGADVKATTEFGSTALHMVAVNADLGTITFLAKAGAPLEAKDGWQHTALHTAAVHARPGKATELIKAGAKISAKDEDRNTPLHLATKAQFVSVLVRNGADIEAKNVHGRTPLHTTALKWPEAARELIAQGANVNTEDDGGFTPLHIAASRRAPKLAKALIEAGAKIDAKDPRGWAPLTHAAFWGLPKTAQLLIEAGAALNTQDFGREATPLHWAAAGGYAEIVKLLIDARADMKILTRNGETAYDMAPTEDMRSLLKKHGCKPGSKEGEQ